MAANGSVTYREFGRRSKGFQAVFAILAAFLAAGLAAAWFMGTEGHHVTGMNNQIVWGMPHVFAVFLIVAASGALNVASIGSVFGRAPYKPLARLSALLAMGLLIGGLAVLVLDLGRPDRLAVAMTNYNFKSIFAWNIFLYTGFLGVVAVYLWLMMERRLSRHAPACGLVAFVWRLVLTTGTGLIFGFLVARQAYDAALFAPLFIALSLAQGMAVFLLVLIAVQGVSGRALGAGLLDRMARLLGIFLAAQLYFVAVQHLTNLYASEHLGVERFLLVEGGAITNLFWIGQVLLGGALPLILLFHPLLRRARTNICLASGLVVLGGLAQIYVIIIGGQAYPLELFPGMDARSSYFDGVINTYTPSLPELALGMGGVALAGIIVLVGLRAFRFMPDSLEDS